MPNIKSAEKRVRTSEARRQMNAANKSRLNTARRQFLAVIASGDKAKSQEAFTQFCSVLDKSAKKGVISKNAADRRKSRACAKVSAQV